VKGAARLCFAAATAMFSAGLMIDKGAAGLSVITGLALTALGLFLMTLR
jgi:hypothetical protein